MEWRTGKRMKLGAVALLALLGILMYSVSQAGPTTITLNPRTTYQTFSAWETTAILLGRPEDFDRRLEVFDHLIDDIGITRIRLEAFAGDENTTRSFQRYRAGEIDLAGWKAVRFTNVNDDDDPFHINPAGFDFADLDWRVEKTVLPLMERAATRGQKLDISFTYVAFTNQNKGGLYLHTNPEEYAEFILAVFLHLHDKYGIVPTTFEPLLEGDNSTYWTPGQLGRAAKAAVDRLAHAGFNVRVIAPSMSDASKTLPWLDGMLTTPGLAEHMVEISYHRYHGGKPAVLKQIADRAAGLGIGTSMLEYWFGKATYQLLQQDLTVANVTSWQPRATDSFYHIGPDGALVMEEDIRFNRLYFQAIRPGDQRIAATSSRPGVLDAVAFRKPDGKIAIVVQTQSASSGEILGLPEGDYAQESALASGNIQPTTVHVGPEGKVAVLINGPGVLSLRPLP